MFRVRFIGEVGLAAQKYLFNSAAVIVRWLCLVVGLRDIKYINKMAKI